MNAPPPNQAPDLGKKHRILLALERFSRRHYGLIFLLAALALVVGVWSGKNLEIETKFLDLIPDGNRQVDTFKEALEDYGSIDFLMVLLEAEEGQGPDELEDFADEFAKRMRELDELVEFVEYRFDPDADFLELFYENALLFLPPDRLDELAQRLSDEAIEERIEQIHLTRCPRRPAPSPRSLTLKDPLGLMPLFLDRLMGNRGVLQVDLRRLLPVPGRQESLIMLVKPIGPSQDLEFDRRLLEGVRGAEESVREMLAPVRVHYGGNFAVVLDETAMVKKDVSFNLFFSLAAVSALYWLCYRRFAALLYSSLPLLVGQALTFFLCFLVLGGLNASSSAFTALLMGLGTDFVIVMYARYVEERQAGRSLAEATECMIGETGLGVFTGAITSAGTFLAMTTSQFRGLKDLGFLIGSGILLCAVAIVFMLPAMIKWNEGVRRRKVDSVGKLHLQSFYIEHLITFSARNRRLMIAIVVGLTVASGFVATKLDFDDTINALRSQRSPAYQVQEKITAKFGASLSYMMAIAEADTPDEAVADREDRGAGCSRSSTTARHLVRFDPDLPAAGVRSSRQVLPAARSRRRRGVRSGADRGDPSSRRSTENGLRASRSSRSWIAWTQFLTPRASDRAAGPGAAGSGHLLERYVRTRRRRVRIVTYMFLADPRWKREAPPGLVEALTGGRRGHRRHRHQRRRPRVPADLQPRGAAGGAARPDRRVRVAVDRLPQAQPDRDRDGPAGLRRDHDARRDEGARHSPQLRQRVRGHDDPRRGDRLQHSSGAPDEPVGWQGRCGAARDRQGGRDGGADQHRRLRYAGARQLPGAAQLRQGRAARFDDLPVHGADPRVPALMARRENRKTHRARRLILPMFWIAILLGIVEGLTEFLPISSTGHLIVTSHLVGFEGRRAELFEIFIQLGAILAVVWEYRVRLFGVVRELPTSAKARGFAGRMFIAFLPAAVVGLLVHDFISEHLFNPRTVAAGLIVGAILILIVERLPLKARTDQPENTSVGQALAIGAAQCMALWPGFSRSAATILGGLGVGLDRKAATEFSFFLAIPTMVGATGYSMLKLGDSLVPGDLLWLSIAFLVSFLVAWAWIRGARTRPMPFGVAVLAVGALRCCLRRTGPLPGIDYK